MSQPRRRSKTYPRLSSRPPLAPITSMHVKFDGYILSVPNYSFAGTILLSKGNDETGIARGYRIADNLPVIAKVSPHSLRLEREFHIARRLLSYPNGPDYIVQVLELVQLPNDGLSVLIFVDEGQNHLLDIEEIQQVWQQSSYAWNREETMSEPRSASSYSSNDNYLLVNNHMDMDTFLEFAILCSECLQFIHKHNFIHGELRPSAFIWSRSGDSFASTSINNKHGKARTRKRDSVKLWNFGTGLKNYEGSVMLREGWKQMINAAAGNELLEQTTIEDNMNLSPNVNAGLKALQIMLNFISPEQTNRTTHAPDHRTDLYSVGVIFYSLLTQELPFDGNPMDIVHSVLSHDILAVHEVRPDVPLAISGMIEKLTRKNPDDRYNSASGLQEDLLECRRRLTAWDGISERIPPFPLGQRDVATIFTLPSEIYGRSDEIEFISSVIRRLANLHSPLTGLRRMTGTSTADGSSDSGRTKRSESAQPPSISVIGSISGSAITNETSSSAASKFSSRSNRSDRLGCEVIALYGLGGVGKSTLVNVIQVTAREYGYLAISKFDSKQQVPYSCILKCLSSIFKQLLAESEDEIAEFYAQLKTTLGPQFINIQLMVELVPELKPILGDISNFPKIETLDSADSVTRFHSVVIEVVKCVAERKILTLFFDDLHNADESSLSLISTLVSSRIKLLIIVAYRPTEISLAKVHSLFQSEYARVTYLEIKSLDISAIRHFIATALHQKEFEVEPMVNLIMKKTLGNPFYTRQLILIMKKKGLIFYGQGRWEYDLQGMQQMLNNGVDPDGVMGVDFLLERLKELPVDGQRFVMWASFIGNTFNWRTVKYLMTYAESESSGSEADEGISSELKKDTTARFSSLDKKKYNRDGDTSTTTSEESTNGELSDHSINEKRKHRRRTRKYAVNGLQAAVQEGILIPGIDDEFEFVHDRYAQAAYILASDKDKEKMHLKIGQMLIGDKDTDIYLIADHFTKCINLVKQFPDKATYREILLKAGEKASISGAHVIAAKYFSCCMELLPSNSWEDGPDSSYQETLVVYLRCAELEWWRGSPYKVKALLKEVFEHARSPMDRSQAWKIQQKVHFQFFENQAGLEALLRCLEELGLHNISKDVTSDEVDEIFLQVKEEVHRHGVEKLANMPVCTDIQMLTLMNVLQEACTAAYWGSPYLVSSFALRLVQISIAHGASPSSGIGFVWVGSMAAEKYSDFAFAVETGEIGSRQCENYSSGSEKVRGLFLYTILLYQYSHSIRERLPILHQTCKNALATGDRIYASLSQLWFAMDKFYVGHHLSETLKETQISFEDISNWSENIISAFLTKCNERMILALQGKTNISHADTILDDDEFNEREYSKRFVLQDSVPESALNWLWSFKLIPLFLFGFHKSAAELGFDCFRTHHFHPCHRHTRMALYFHSLALISCLRDPGLDTSTRERYSTQVVTNQKLLELWATHSAINYQMWYIIIEAELSSLEGDIHRTCLLYEAAIKRTLQGGWIQDAALSYELAGEFYLRNGLTAVGSSLLKQSVTAYIKWGAWGKAHHLERKYEVLFNKNQFISQKESVGIQTDYQMPSVTQRTPWTDSSDTDETVSNGEISERVLLQLDIVDLASILKSFRVLSSEVNFDNLLEKMMGIILENSGAESGAIILKENGAFIIAAHITRSKGCTTFKPPRFLASEEKLVSNLIVNYTIHTKENLLVANIAEDARFATGKWFARNSFPKSVICIPILHKASVLGALYLEGAEGSFTNHHMTVLTLLCQQIGISVTNALLFKGVQKATMANLSMIHSQKQALEEAREAKEQALKAMRLKSYFLANMSHELRTPFSGFYGMISLLSDTPLDPDQQEFVHTAKQSCEMLLQIIDDLLNFSKLEAGKVTLDFANFSVEDALADVVELLITLSSKKGLDLAYFVDLDVPKTVIGDCSRLRQILLNLIGNAIKFSHHGWVRVRCMVDHNPLPQGVSSLKSDEIMLRFEVEDTGIGMTEDQMKGLFEPFSQVDGSSTRIYGGTGLGLSICLQLVNLMQGECGVKSKVHEGSTFFFTIRAKMVQSGVFEDVGRETEALGKALNNSEILIVTNTSSTMEMLRDFLQTFKISHVSSEEEAISRLDKNFDAKIPFQIIVIDLPKSLCMGLLRYIESSSHHKDIPCIFLYTPTATNVRSGKDELEMMFNDTRLIRMAKPIRRLKILRACAKALKIKDPKLKNINSTVSPLTNVKSAFTPEELELFKQKRILVAEDNPIAQKLISKQLSKLGFSVDCTNNGLEAVEAWQSKPQGYYDLAFIDHHMPKCDGVEATKRIRKLEEELQIKMPIIALTADIQVSARNSCLNAGMDEYLTKPLMTEDMNIVLRRYIVQQHR